MKKIIICVVTLAALVGSVCALAACDKKNIDNPAPAALKTEGTNLIDTETGETVILKGINAGGWLISESWMCPVRKNAEQETYQKQTIEILTERFGAATAEELLDVYYDNWWQESDFDNVKEAGFNCIRLPFTYMNLLNLTDMTFREDAFQRFDWFIKHAADRGLYVIPDMHGAPGSQNGRDHSGDITGAELYTSQKNMDATVMIWREFAARYKGNATIAAFDLLNEPEGDFRSGTTDRREWDFYDVLYDAVRAEDPNRILIMESVWEPINLPKPTLYGWENVMYELHCYNWSDADYQSFWDMKEAYFRFAKHNVPILIGEFTCFENDEGWQITMDYFAEKAFSWTVWTYKVIGTNSSWGLYTGAPDADIVYIETDSAETIKEKWARTGTGHGGNYIFNEYLYSKLSPYLSR